MLGSPLGSILDGKYRLVRELSRGGMGAVYAATHQHLGTEVAVKLLHAASGAGSLASSSPATRQRQFLREARLAAQLRHPGIVQVLDFGISGDVPYLVMELVPGESLRQHLTRRGRLPLPEVLAVVEGVSAALAVAHARGVVHRDLKPENIVIDASGERLGVKVVDFGLATMSPELAAASAGVASARDPEVSGSSLVPVMAGTPAYLSPEQASGQGPVTAASDLWALGVIAFECLTGQRPFPGEALGELILQICAWAPPVPSALAEVPDGFDAWFSSACARAPSDRFSSAPAMAAALAGLLRGSSPALARSSTAPLVARVGAAPVAARRWPAQRRWLGAGVAVVGLVVAVVAVGGGKRGAPSLARREAASGAPSPAAEAEPSRGRQLARWPGGVALRIAVLPIAGELRDELASVPDSLTDALISGVAARTTHKLIARASVARFPAGAARDLGVVIRQLGVQRVVVAALTREGPSLALSLELLDGEQTHLWSRRLRRPVAELEQLCDDAARAIAGEVGASRAVASTSRDPAAYRAYLSGRFFWAKRDHDSLLTAIEYFQRATELEPGYAQAWVGLADSYLLLPWMGPTPRSAAHRKAQEALGRALLLDPDSPEAHASRGNQLLEIEWSFLAAEAAFRRALELDPNNATAHQWLAELLMLFRRFDEADAEMLLALELEPLNAAVHKDRGKVLYYAGRYADSEAASRKAIELDPGQPWARQSLGYALGAQGRYDEALAALRAEPRWQLSAMAPFVAVQELWVASQRGDRAEATRAAEVVERARLEQFAPWTVAFVAAVKGDVDAMLRALDQALIQRDPFMPFTAVNREFDPYRADPRFMAIMTRAGLWPWR